MSHLKNLLVIDQLLYYCRHHCQDEKKNNCSSNVDYWCYHYQDDNIMSIQSSYLWHISWLLIGWKEVDIFHSLLLFACDHVSSHVEVDMIMITLTSTWPTMSMHDLCIRTRNLPNVIKLIKMRSFDLNLHGKNPVKICLYTHTNTHTYTYTHTHTHTHIYTRACTHGHTNMHIEYYLFIYLPVHCTCQQQHISNYNKINTMQWEAKVKC